MKYIQRIENDDGWTDWIKAVSRRHRIACCDCGLVHDLEFRARKSGAIEFRAARNHRATAARRRGQRRPVGK